MTNEFAYPRQLAKGISSPIVDAQVARLAERKAALAGVRANTRPIRPTINGLVGAPWIVTAPVAGMASVVCQDGQTSSTRADTTPAQTALWASGSTAGEQSLRGCPPADAALRDQYTLRAVKCAWVRRRS
jgi:hypothetical protein